MSPNARIKPLVNALLAHFRTDIKISAPIMGFAALLPLAAHVQAQEVELNIPAQPLDSALREFGRQTNLQMIYKPEDVQGLSSTGVKGKMSPNTAAEQLLQGTSLSYELSGNTVTLHPAGVLNTVSVHGAEINATTEGTGSYTTGSMRTATKLDLSIRETPQSVAVISNQLIEDKRIDDFRSLMKNITGISSNSTVDPRTTYYARGFSLDYYQIDGILTLQDGATINNYNMDQFERVEIVKGANGLMSGAGNPAATINMRHKRAGSKELVGSLDAAVGSWDTYKLKADVTTPLTQSGDIRARVVVSHKETDTFKDRYHQENDLIYATVDADLTKNMTFSAGASYELDDRDGAITDFPAFYSDGSRTSFSRSKNYSPDWLSWDTEIESYFADLKYQFDSGAFINAIYTHRDMKTKDRLSGYTSTWVPLNMDGSGLSLWWTYQPKKIKEDGFDVYTSVPFSLANREHEIVAGLQYNEQESDQTYRNGGSLVIDNYLTSNGSELARPGGDVSIPYFNYMTKQKAIYLTGKFEIQDDLKLILGSRLTDWEYDFSNYQSNIYYGYEVDKEITPFAGLIYEIGEYHSAYVSYTDIFKPQNYKDENETLLDPIVGKNYEVGIKGEYFGGALNAAVTLFRIEQDNVAQIVDGVYLPDGTGAYRGVDGVTGEGVELEIGGQLSESWDVTFGFSNFEAEDQNGNKVNTTSPRNNLNFFTKYTDGPFSIGGGVNWKSKSFAGTGNYKVTQEDYAIVDIMASYRFSQSLSAQLNVYNLLDETYYLGYGSTSYSYGDPVNSMLSLQYTW